MMPSCAVCTIALPVSERRHSLDPASASNKTVVEYLAAANSLELAQYARHDLKAATYLATAENITNKLQEKFAFGL